MKSQFIITLLFLFFLFFTSCLTQKETAQKKEIYKVVQTAKKELPQILEKIPAGSEQSYGFESKDEFQNSKVGKPFRFFTIKNNQLADTSPYTLPITVDNQFRALATVEYINDTLHIVDFGSNVLAKEIQSVCNDNKQLNFIGILRVYEIYSDFLMVDSKGQNQFIPLTSAKLFLKNNINKPIQKYYNENQIINLIKTIKP
ncbi:MAG: hypothetical protein ACOYMD_06880 [Paludibacter sp.]